MFHHLVLAKKENHQHDGITYELVVYLSQEDGHLRGYISAGGFSDNIAEMSGDVAHDMKNTTGDDPVEFLLNAMKCEINAGKFPVPKGT